MRSRTLRSKWLDRLHEVVVGARGDALEDLLGLPACSDQDDRGQAARWVGPDPLAELESVHAGHHPVRHHHVGPIGQVPRSNSDERLNRVVCRWITRVAESVRDAILMVSPGLAFDAFFAALEHIAGEKLRDGPLQFARRSVFFKGSRAP